MVTRYCSSPRNSTGAATESRRKLESHYRGLEVDFWCEERKFRQSTELRGLEAVRIPLLGHGKRYRACKCFFDLTYMNIFSSSCLYCKRYSFLLQLVANFATIFPKWKVNPLTNWKTLQLAFESFLKTCQILGAEADSCFQTLSGTNGSMFSLRFIYQNFIKLNTVWPLFQRTKTYPFSCCSLGAPKLRN